MQWMREACDQYGVTLSLVMPNEYNHAENEVKYGHMMRIDEDVSNGGWDNNSVENGWPQNHISGRRRGQWQSNWSQWGNVFDGLTGFADVGGRGQIVLDADFIRLNRFDRDSSLDSTTNNTALLDAQKRSTVSLFTMAGSPLCIADQYDTIDQYNITGISNKTYYQNTELLALNSAGFVAKPMGLGQSERWAGQLPDGSWVVGLFNRDRTPKEQSVDFQKDLGINGQVSVRDLWSHTDLGQMSSYSATLHACDCKIIKITPNNSPRYEAEAASLRDGSNYNDNHGNYSGFAFADKLENSKGNVLFAVKSAAGSHNVQIRYSNGGAADTTADLFVNNQKLGYFTFPTVFNGAWDTWVNCVYLQNRQLARMHRLIK